MKKYIFIVELFYFVYIIIKNLHLNTFKSTIYKFLHLRGLPTLDPEKRLFSRIFFENLIL